MFSALLTRLFAIGPILFGIGIFAPVFAALVKASGLGLPFGVNPLYVGLGIGVAWGAIAAKRGSWI